MRHPAASCGYSAAPRARRPLQRGRCQSCRSASGRQRRRRCVRSATAQQQRQPSSRATPRATPGPRAPTPRACTWRLSVQVVAVAVLRGERLAAHVMAVEAAAVVSQPEGYSLLLFWAQQRRLLLELPVQQAQAVVAQAGSGAGTVVIPRSAPGLPAMVASAALILLVVMAAL